MNQRILSRERERERERERDYLVSFILESPSLQAK